jgi:hypothetical protein
MKKFASYYMSAVMEIYNSPGATEWKQGASTPGCTRVPSKDELDKYFRAADVPGYDKRVHWCGIFQVYLLKQAGVACHWDRAIVDDSNGKDLEIVSGEEAKRGLQAGDILRVGWAQHHFMALQPVEKGSIPCVEGNAGGLDHPTLAANWMGNALHNVVADIQYRYRVVS